MTVRWKPLIILSGVFLVIAVVGVIAITYTLVPRGSGDILPLARAERKAKQFENAKIHYQRALQKDSKNSEIYEEFAGMFAEWSAEAPPEKKAELWGLYLAELEESARYGKTRKGPRRRLLLDGMNREEVPQAVHWAKELLALDPEDADAHFVLASALLEERSPKLPEIKRHLAALEAAKAPQVRRDWVKARLADVSGDDVAREAVFAADRALALPADASAVDRMALIRLRALDLQTTKTPADLAARSQALQTEVRSLLAAQPLAAARTVRLGVLLERVQKSLAQDRLHAGSSAQPAITAIIDAIDQDVETLFQKALEGPTKPELSVYLAYADHMRYREKYAKCQQVVAQALQTPMAQKTTFGDLVMGLHSIAIESALAGVEDKARFEKASTHIQELLGSSNQRYQGLGHLFQGAIDLELSGVAGVARKMAQGEPAAPSAVQPKLRASALNHLKLAAAQLPEVAEAQARYGVALVLAQEQTIGRQYLQNAVRLGNLAPQYQVWAAWSMVQAGYPEEAEPIVNQLLTEVELGRQPRALAGTLHLLNAEIHQARRTPKDLSLALTEYLKSVDAGQQPTAAVQLRLIQLDVQLGNVDRALKRITQLRELEQGGPSLEHLAVLTLQEKGDKAEARKSLDAALKKYPDSEELVVLDAALLVKEDKSKEADHILAAYLAKFPDAMSATLMRAQILAELLDKSMEARDLLDGIAERSDNSAPLVQLALLDLKLHDYDAMTKTIAKIRGRWKEAATGDVLDAQLALAKGDVSSAVEYFNTALKKDPNNKLVQFWKAQLDSRTGASKDAAQAFEAIAKDHPVKELDEGLTLSNAAESALANLALQTGDTDSAIRRFEELRAKSEKGTLRRADRWQLAAAYAQKGQWPAAKREVATMLNDSKNPVSEDERVRGANFYRIHNDPEAAAAQLDYVLEKNPTNAGAVVVRSYMLADAKKFAEAATVLRKAINEAPKTGKPPAIFFLMLAAVEKLAPPETDSSRRALAALDEGIKAQPEAMELVNAKYRVLHAARDEKAAVAFVESLAQDDKKGRFRRFLVDVYREKRNYEGAVRVLKGLIAENPKDAVLAANQVQILLYEAIAAAEKNDRDAERTFNAKVAGLVREYRTQFPNDQAFLQADCDLAARKGDLARANAITQEMDKIAKNSPRGPLNRARLYAVQGRTREAADSYGEALERNPRQPEVRLMLGQTRLRLGEADDAIRQARLVLENDHDNADALLLEARALAIQGRLDREKESQVPPGDRPALQGRRSGTRISPGPTTRSPRSSWPGDARAEAIGTLKKGVEQVPDDTTGVSLLIETLTGLRPGAPKPTPAEMDDAKTDRDRRGRPRHERKPLPGRGRRLP